VGGWMNVKAAVWISLRNKKFLVPEKYLDKTKAFENLCFEV
jgi:hypothetical protein